MKSMLDICSELLVTAQADGEASRRDLDIAESMYGFFALVDLRASYAFRENEGEGAAYVRSEAFVRLLRRIWSPQSRVAVLKEMGDALLVSSADGRPIVEGLAVLDTVVDLWDHGGVGQKGYPTLEFRSAVTFGRATRIVRSSGIDFLGAPVDRLARLSNVRSDEPAGSLATIDQAAWSMFDDFELNPAVFSRSPLTTASGVLKPGEPPLRYGHIILERAQFRRQKDGFAEARAAAAPD